MDLENFVNGEEGKEIKNDNEVITPRYLIDLLKPIINDELVAQCRYDRTGIRIKFCNGQQFHLTVIEIK